MIGKFCVKFAGTNFCNYKQTEFSWWELTFAIFRKYQVPSINDIFVFVIKWVQYRNTYFQTILRYAYPKYD